MRYAVLSDIHANLEALTAVLDRTAGMGVDRYLCLGDLVGYNANPNECIDIVRSERMVCVLGNHDSAACGLTEPDEFSTWAKQAVLWTRQQLTADNREFLRGLPRETAVDDLFLCHGAIHDTDRYLLYLDDVREMFDLMATLPGSPRICFHGHTHLRTAFRALGRSLVRELKDVRMQSDRRYLVNPGAVGQPRDGDPRAAWALLDLEARSTDFRRVTYDIERTVRSLLAAGFGEAAADRLRSGV